MKKGSLNAVILERLLIIGIIPLIGVSIFVIHSLFGVLEQKSKEASHANIDSEVGAENINDLKKLEEKLAQNQDVARRAAAIVADSKQYRYQDQIVNDINTYAAAAGVTILGFDFNENSEGTNTEGNATSTEGTSSTGNSTATQQAPPSNTSATAAPGLKTVNASIQLDSPIPLTDFLIFLKYIEQNVTKMQITGVTLTPAEDPNLISNPTINITVYTR